MKMHLTLLVTFCLLGECSLGQEASDASFRNDIAPMMRDHCLACHGPKKAEGGYRVDTFEELFKAGDSGEAPVAASLEHGGELLRRLNSNDADERMPAETDPLSQDQIAAFQRWVAGGAKFDGEDARQPLSLVIPPAQFADPPTVYQQAIPITATVYSPDGASVVTSGYHEVVVWNASDATLVRRIKNIGQRVFAMAFSFDGRTLAVGCGEPGRSGEVRLVDFTSGDIKSVVARTEDIVLDLAFRPGTSELAIALSDSTIRIVNLDTLKEVRTIASHADWVTAVSWSDDGTRLASASRDKSAKVYDGATGELLSSYLGHNAAVRGVSILADNLHVASVGSDSKLHRWEVEGAKKVAEIGIGSDAYRLIRSDTDLYVPCADKRLLKIDLNKNAVAQEYRGHSDGVLTACVPPSNTDLQGVSTIASGGFDGEVRIWNVADAAVVRQWIAKP